MANRQQEKRVAARQQRATDAALALSSAEDQRHSGQSPSSPYLKPTPQPGSSPSSGGGGDRDEAEGYVCYADMMLASISIVFQCIVTPTLFAL